GESLPRRVGSRKSCIAGCRKRSRRGASATTSLRQGSPRRRPVICRRRRRSSSRPWRLTCNTSTCLIRRAAHDPAADRGGLPHPPGVGGVGAGEEHPPRAHLDAPHLVGAAAAGGLAGDGPGGASAGRSRPARGAAAAGGGRLAVGGGEPFGRAAPSGAPQGAGADPGGVRWPATEGA